MKGFVYFVFTIAVLAGIASVFWWLADGSTPEEQLEYLKATFDDSVSGKAASNTAETASKLGKVLKGSFEEAQDVYQNGAEAKYE